MSARIAILLPLMGCVGPGAVADEMREGLAHANEALAVVLVAVEPPSYGVDPLASLDDRYRHPAGGPCPSNERDVEDPDAWVLATLDYGGGCVPRSGLLATVVSGSTWMQHDEGRVEMEYEGLRLALRHALSGDFSGLVTGDEEGRTVDGSGEVRLDSEDRALAAFVTLQARLTPTSIHFDAEVDLGERQVELSDVVLPYPEIRGECPTPSGGSVVVGGGRRDVHVDLGAPGAGDVTVRTGRRTSDPTWLCGQASWVFRG